jgi:hypothetical protein
VLLLNQGAKGVGYLETTLVVDFCRRIAPKHLYAPLDSTKVHVDSRGAPYPCQR